MKKGAIPSHDDDGVGDKETSLPTVVSAKHKLSDSSLHSNEVDETSVVDAETFESKIAIVIVNLSGLKSLCLSYNRASFAVFKWHNQ